MQGCNLGGEGLDGLGGGGIVFGHRCRRVTQLLDLGLKGGDQGFHLGIGLGGLRDDPDHLGFWSRGGWQGLEDAKPVTGALEHIRCRGGQGRLLFGLGEKVKQDPAETDQGDGREGQKR